MVCIVRSAKRLTLEVVDVLAVKPRIVGRLAEAEAELVGAEECMRSGKRSRHLLTEAYEMKLYRRIFIRYISE